MSNAILARLSRLSDDAYGILHKGQVTLRSLIVQPSKETLAALPQALTHVTYINLAGDYSYMSEAYYQSLEAEFDEEILPTTGDALDAYVVPIAMEKARQQGLEVPEYEIIMDKLSPPVLAYPINPFSTRYELVEAGDDLNKKLRTLTKIGKYATLCQKLPSDYRIDVVRCVVGQCLIAEYQEFSRRVFEVFKLPLMRIRVIVTTSSYLLSAIEPLPFDDLTLNEKKLLSGLGLWRK